MPLKPSSVSFRKKGVVSFLKGCFLTLLFLPAFSVAEDVDIFWDQSTTDQLKPNVLFILDSSSSMGIKENSSSGKTSRLNLMKQSFGRMIDNIGNVKVGVMQFNSPGGAVLYPIADIEDSAVGQSIFTSFPVQSSEDDGDQSGGDVNLSQPVVRIGYGAPIAKMNSVFYDPEASANVGVQAGVFGYSPDKKLPPTGSKPPKPRPPSNKAFAFAETAPNNIKGAFFCPYNDASGGVIKPTGYSAEDFSALFEGHECDAGVTEYNASILTRTSTAGLRFPNVGLTKSSRVDHAFIHIFSKDGVDERMTFRVSGDLSRSFPPFGPGYLKIKARLRYSRTTAEVVWNTQAVLPDTYFKTIDIAPVVNEIIQSDGWSDGDPISVLLQVDNGDGLFIKPKEKAEFSVDDYRLELNWNNSEEPKTITTGIRFGQVTIPRGAIIKRAFLRVSPSGNKQYGKPFPVKLGFENTADSTQLQENPYNLSKRMAAITVPWRLPQKWEYGQKIDSSDISASLQAIVNKPAWCSGNAVTLSLTPDALADEEFRSIVAFDDRGVGEDRSATQLLVEFEPTAEVEERCPQIVVNQTINDDKLDAVEQRSGSVVVANATPLELSGGYLIGLQFSDLRLRSKAKVEKAYIEIVSASDIEPGVRMSTEIFLEQAVDTLFFAPTLKNLTSRIGRSWQNADRWNISDWRSESRYRSPNVAGLLNKLVNQPDWFIGGRASFILRGVGAGEASIHSAGSNPAWTARLVVETDDRSTDVPKASPTRMILKNIVNRIELNGWTPMSDAYYEAAQYFRGGKVHWGLSRDVDKIPGAALHPDELDSDFNPREIEGLRRVSHPLSLKTPGSFRKAPGCTAVDLSSAACSSNTIDVGAEYQSPIQSCEENHIVLLTDGDPSFDHSSNKINQLDGINCTQDITGVACMKALSHWLAVTDVVQDGRPFENNVYTHTIAFNLTNPETTRFLSEVANDQYPSPDQHESHKHGGFYSALNADSLNVAFDSILRNIQAVEEANFASPGVSINQLNRLYHSNELFFSVFRPDIKPHWAGNIKKYKIDPISGDVVDFYNNPVLDADTGFIKSDTRDFWASEKGGAQVMSGGVVSHLKNPEERKIYTFDESKGKGKIAIETNQLHERNYPTLVSNVELGVLADETAVSILRWLNGYNETPDDEGTNTDELRSKMLGDSIHAEPHMVSYRKSLTSTKVESTLYFPTNEGMLHAFAVEDESPRELYAFMPEKFIRNLNTLYQDKVINAHPYGLDGAPISFIDDQNNDGVISGKDEKVYLYFGMRRGGYSYYALDVTNRASPKFLWKITGGAGVYSSLGQTWSTPVQGKVKVAGEIKSVLIFAGGYDPKQDGALDETLESNIGNALYMVDAITGKLIWMTSNRLPLGVAGQVHSEMQYPIPSKVKVLDMNQDGFVDQLYVGDLGGQLWRFDINNEADKRQVLVNGGRIADLSIEKDGTKARVRQFFSTPDVSLISNQGKVRVGIGIGSGSTHNPTSVDTEDRLYMLFEDSVSVPRQDYSVQALITEKQLSDRTTAIDEMVISQKGWMIRLTNPGEKSLSAGTTFNGQSVYSTFEPQGRRQSCSGMNGKARTYLLTSHNARPVADLNGNQKLDVSDRFRVLVSPMIPPKASLVLVDGLGSQTIHIGAEQPFKDFNQKLDAWQKSYWYQN